MNAHDLFFGLAAGLVTGAAWIESPLAPIGVYALAVLAVGLAWYYGADEGGDSE